MGLFDFLTKKSNKSALELKKMQEIVTHQRQHNQLIDQLYRYLGKGMPFQSEEDFTKNIRTYYEGYSALYAVVSRKAMKAAEIGFLLQKKNREGEWEEVVDHEVYDLLDNPNAQMGRQEFWETAYSFLEVNGNSFIYAPRLNSGKTKELWIAPANLIDIIAGKKFMKLVEGYQITYSGASTPIPTKDMMHVKLPSLDYNHGREFYGLSPIKSLLISLEKGISNQRAMKAAFENQGASGAIFPDYDPSTAEIDMSTVDKMQSELDDRISGTEKTKKILALKAKVGYINFGLTAVEMQMIEDANLTLRDICRVYHVPSILFNDPSGTTYNNMAEARKDMVVSGVLPSVRRMCGELNRWYVNDVYGKDYRLVPQTGDVEELQPDKLQMVDTLTKATFMKVGEKQRIYGIDVDPDTENLYVDSSGKPIRMEVPDDGLGGFRFNPDVNNLQKEDDD